MRARHQLFQAGLMSQVAKSPSSQSSMRPFILNEGITVNGFLPNGEPMKVLPHPYYEPWEAIIQDLSPLLKAHNLRSEVDKLPILSIARLSTIPEKRRAYVILAFLASGYVWGGETPADILPASIALPLLEISRELDIEPIATYTSLNLWNTTSTTDDFSDLDSLRSLHTFTGTKDEEWFYVISVAMESEGAKLVHALIDNLEAVRSGNLKAITTFLEDTKAYILKLTALLERMYEKCDPDVFYFSFRPFLAGSMNMEQAGLPNGVFYSEDNNGKGSWRKLRGGSNGQSPIVQFLDAVLGIKHYSTGTHKPGGDTARPAPSEINFHIEMRRYMPGQHRRFLDYIEEVVSIRQVVDRSMLSLFATQREQEDHLKLQMAYQDTVQALTAYRNKHLQIVTRYVILPAKRGVKSGEMSSKVVNLSVPSAPETELTGAGGTTLMPFLKQSRDETQEAARVVLGLKGESDCGKSSSSLSYPVLSVTDLAQSTALDSLRVFL